MAKMSAKGAIIVVDDSAGTPRTISADCVSYEIKADAGGIEITGLGEGSHNKTPGLATWTVTLDILWNSLATTGARTVLNGIFGSSTSKTVTITPEGSGAVFSGEFMLDALPAKGTPSGAIQIGSVSFSVMGATAPAWA